MLKEDPNFSAYPPHTENDGMCFDDFPLEAGEAEVPLPPLLVELPQLSYHIGLVNAHPEVQDLINCCLAR